MGGIFTLLGAMNGTAFSMAAVFALGVQRISTVLLSSSSSPLPSLPWSGSRRRAARRAGRRLRPLPLCHRGHRPAAGLRLLHPDPHPGGGTMLDTAGLPGWWAGIVIVLCFTAAPPLSCGWVSRSPSSASATASPSSVRGHPVPRPQHDPHHVSGRPQQSGRRYRRGNL